MRFDNATPLDTTTDHTSGKSSFKSSFTPSILTSKQCEPSIDAWNKTAFYVFGVYIIIRGYLISSEMLQFDANQLLVNETENESTTELIK